jgi:SAM-dependent methyltransferase
MAHNGDEGGSASPAWQEIARLYVRGAGSRSPASVRAARAELLRLAGPVHGRRVLDLGCGTGGLARRLAEAGARVIGVDASDEAIRSAQADCSLLDSEHPPQFQLADPTDPKTLPAGPFDLVTLLLLGDDPPRADALRCAARLLRRGGRVVVGLPHPYADPKAAGRPLQALLGWFRDAGLRLIDAAEPDAEARRDLNFSVILAERPRAARRRRPRRSAS